MTDRSKSRRPEAADRRIVCANILHTLKVRALFIRAEISGRESRKFLVRNLSRDPGRESLQMVQRLIYETTSTQSI
jgi:hypothetical protein